MAWLAHDGHNKQRIAGSPGGALGPSSSATDLSHPGQAPGAQAAVGSFLGHASRAPPKDDTGLASPTQTPEPEPGVGSSEQTRLHGRRDGDVIVPPPSTSQAQMETLAPSHAEERRLGFVGLWGGCDRTTTAYS